MGVGGRASRHHSYETHAAKWVGFRQPVVRVAMERMGKKVDFTYQANPGEVWEENEFWIELSWRIDPDGSLGIRKHYESPYRPGEKITVDEYYRWIFENRSRLARGGRGRGTDAAGVHAEVRRVRDREAGHAPVRRSGPGRRAEGEGRPMSRVITSPPPSAQPGDHADAGGRRAGRPCRRRDGRRRAVRGWPTPSGKLEFFSRTLYEWGWPEYAIPTYIDSHVAPRIIDARRAR